MAALAEGVFQALLAAFLYLVPAVSLHLLVGGLANPRIEGWEPTEEAVRRKRPYRVAALWGQRINLVLIALFLIEVVMFLVLRSADCAPDRDHTTGAAHNIVLLADRAFTVGFVLLAAAALAAIPWAATYLATARRRGWTDPRRHDYLVIHLVFMPLALLLLYVAFGIVPRMVCPGL